MASARRILRSMKSQRIEILSVEEDSEEAPPVSSCPDGHTGAEDDAAEAGATAVDDAEEPGAEDSARVLDLPCQGEPGKATKNSWKNKLRGAFTKSSRKSRPGCGEDHPVESACSRCSAYVRGGLTFTRNVDPPEALRPAANRRRHGQLSTRREQLQERRVVEPDPPFSYPYVRDTLLKYERVDNWLKDVLHEYRKLVRWKHPARSAWVLSVGLHSLWMNYLPLLLIAGALLYLNGVSLDDWVFRTQEETKPRRHFGGRRRTVLNDVNRVMKLDMRVSKTFQEISTAFDKVHSLLTWKNPGTTACLMLTLMGLLALAFWEGQGFAFQVAGTVLLMKLFVVDHLFSRFPRLAATCDLISHAWDRLPVRPADSRA
ncbi:GRAM domain-containing protein 4-like [Haemaphysalis longicornis]